MRVGVVELVCPIVSEIIFVFPVKFENDLDGSIFVKARVFRSLAKNCCADDLRSWNRYDKSLLKSSDVDLDRGELTAKSEEVLNSFDQELLIKDLRLKLVIGALVIVVTVDDEATPSLESLSWSLDKTGFISG